MVAQVTFTAWVTLLLCWAVILTVASTAADQLYEQQHASNQRQDALPQEIPVYAHMSATAPYFEKWKDGGCVAPGRRLYSSRLWGFSGNGLAACSKQGVKWADGTVIPQPMRCYQQSSEAVFGEIWAQDKACMPTWGSFKDVGCVFIGYRQFMAPIQNVPNSQDKMYWCANTRALVQSVTFNAPTRCVKSAANSNVYGYFHVADDCCETSDSEAAQGPHQQGLCVVPGKFGLPLPNPSKPRGEVPYDFVTPTSKDEKLMDFMAWVYSGTDTFKNSWSSSGEFIGGKRQVALYAEENLASRTLRLNIVDSYGVLPGQMKLYTSGRWYKMVDALVVPQVLASEATVQQESTPTCQVPSDGCDTPTPRWLIPPHPTPTTLGKGAGYFSLSFPTGGAVQGPRLIVTPKFTGCTFVIGAAYGQLHMAHIQPRNIDNDVLGTAQSLSVLLHDRGALGGFGTSEMGSKNIFTFGGDPIHGYYAPGAKGNARLLGVVTSWTIYLIINFNDAQSILIDASTLACRYRLGLPKPGKTKLQNVNFDTSNCPASGTAADCTGDPPGRWENSPSSAPLRAASIFVNTTNVKEGSCVRLSLKVAAATTPVIFAYVNGVPPAYQGQQRCVVPSATSSGPQTAQMDFTNIDPKKLYEFRVRGTGGADIAGTATLSSCT